MTTTRTRRQKEVLDYIASFAERHGYEPSYQQIARHLRIRSKSAIAKHIVALEQQGLLSRRQENGRFGLSVAESSNSTDAIAQVSLVEDLSLNSGNKTLCLPRFLFGALDPANMFAFRVPADSMIDEHICAGDIALIERRTFARSGECVAALVENRHSTIERLHHYGVEVELRPANAKLTPMRLPAHYVAVCGIYRGLLRSIC